MKLVLPVSLFIVLSFPGTLFSQPKKIIDSIEKILPSQKDSVLAKSYNELTWQYRSVDRGKGISYGEKAIALSQQIKFPTGEAQAYNDLGILYMDQQEMDKAVASYRKAIPIREKLGDKKGLAAVYLKIGIVYQKSGKFDKALENGLLSLKLYEDLKDEFSVATALNNVGIANQNVGNVDAALQYHERALAIREKINDKPGLSSSYLALGTIHFLKDDLVQAKYFMEKADTIATMINNYEVMAAAAHNLAAIYDKTGPYEKGLDYAETAFSIREQLGDVKTVVSTLNVWGGLLTKTKQFKPAEDKLLQALQLSDTLLSCLPEKPRIYLSLTDLYEAMGDFKKANEMARLQMKYHDSIYTADMNLRFSDAETKYQTAVKEKEIQKQQFEISKRNYWIAGIGALLLLGTLLGYSYYKRFKLKKEKQLQAEIMHQQDMSTRAVLQAEENERERIARELHDGVGQMMSAAKMNLSAMEGDLAFTNDNQRNAYERIVSLVDEGCKEVRTVSHQMMPNALLKKGLASAIREFIDKIDNRILKVDLYSEGLNERIDTNTETVLYRVVQECVNNVIKHSGANHLDISLIKDSDGISVTIEDNGKGFDTSQKAASEGIGLKNIRTRIDYLKGTVDFDSTLGKGTLVAIHVPLA
ncbi:MAG: tetratricopeptide repeat protein [Chitinophagaceae bacterium]